MNNQELADTIVPFLEEPKDIYELAAEKELNPSTLYPVMKRLEAAGFIKPVKKRGRRVVWQAVQKDDSATA